MSRVTGIVDIDALPLVLSVGEVAEIFGCSPTSIYTLIDNGTLPAVTIGVKGKRISRHVLADYMDGGARTIRAAS